MNGGLTFAPLLPAWAFWSLLALALAAAGLAAIRGRMWGRVAALLALALALSGPGLTEEARTRLDDVVAVIVDQTASQNVGERKAQAERAAATLTERLTRLGGLEVRTARVAEGDPDQGTRLFSALNDVLSDVPRQRLAGVFLITDGQVHDVPDSKDAAQLGAPVHAVLTGAKDETDRRLVIESLPRYGMVGKTLALSFRIEDLGPEPAASAWVTLRLDGKDVDGFPAVVGVNQTLNLPIDHSGAVAVEVQVEARPGEISTVNNRASALVQGIRDRLKVLLVSGMPHAGERAWRNLLKADPAVDLVHFTILRSFEETDGTPLNELALISFPTQELFEDNLSQFDLVVFDRYSRRGILPPQYLENIRKYVREGGAVMFSVGAEYADSFTLYNSPLADILPVMPTNSVVRAAYIPITTTLGLRHPVTADLKKPEAAFGPLIGLVEGQAAFGKVLMTGHGERPLLALDRVGKGRVAMLLTDTLWLWGKGYQGGGPQAELMRRLAHWLMKEPELEEEALTAHIESNRLVVPRRSLEPQNRTATVTLPDGTEQTVELTTEGEGPATGSLPLVGSGLYTARDGALTALAVAGSVNPLETSDMAATVERLAPVLKATGGGEFRLFEGDAPSVRRVREGADPVYAGNSWAGLRDSASATVTGLSRTALMPGWLVLLLTLGGIVAAWVREGR